MQEKLEKEIEAFWYIAPFTGNTMYLSFYVGCIASKEYSVAVLSLRCLLIFSSKFVVKNYSVIIFFRRPKFKKI